MSVLSEELQIYKTTYDLLEMMVDLSRELPKFYRYNVGTRLVDLCLDMLALIYQANMDRDARQQYLTQLLICNHKIEMLLRVCFRKKIFTAGRYAVYMQLQVSIGKQATAWKKNVEH